MTGLPSVLILTRLIYTQPDVALSGQGQITEYFPRNNTIFIYSHIN